MKSLKIILVGGGGHCESVIDVIEQQGKYSVKGVLDKTKKVGEKVLSYDVIGHDDDIESLVSPTTFFLLTVGQIKSASVRRKLSEKLNLFNAKLATVISPRAYVSVHSTISAGTVIMHDVIVNAGARVGEHCILNTKSIIEHGARVGSFCHISTGAIINGDCVLHSDSFVGSNATLSHSVELPKESVIAAGSFRK